MGVQGNLEQLAKAPVGRLLWHYSLPAVVGMMVMALYNVVDRVIIGQVVGPDAIAGLAITFPVMNLATAIGVLVGVGSAARTSILLGAGMHAKAQKVLGNSVVLTVVNALVYLSLFRIFIDDILIAFGASEATLPYAHDFMIWILPGMMMINLAFGLNNLMRSSGYPVRAMITMFIGAGLNMVLAITFVWWLGWGIKGAAIATDLSMTVTAIFVVAHFFRRDATVRFQRGIYRIEWPIVWSIVTLGSAPAVVNAAGCLINVIINRSLLYYGGDSAIAAAGIFVTYTSLLTTVVLGICQGMQPIIGYNYGAGLLTRLRSTYMLAVKVSTVIVCIGWVGGMFFPATIARAFTTSPELIAETKMALSNSMFIFFVVGFQIVSTTLFQSLGQAGKAIFLSLTRQVIFMIPMLLLLPRMWGLRGVWNSFALSDIMATVATIAMVVWQFRALRRKSEQV